MALGEQFESVLEAARTGAQWALAALYRDLHPSILRYLWSRERSEAEDIGSEVWLHAAAALPRFQGDEQGFRRWMFTIARRRLADLQRERARRRTHPAALEAIAGHVEGGDAEHEAMMDLATEAALARVASLPPDQAEVVLLRVLGGLSANEVAGIMGRRPGTIRVLQHRALARLARVLADEAVTQGDLRAM